MKEKSACTGAGNEGRASGLHRAFALWRVGRGACIGRVCLPVSGVNGDCRGLYAQKRFADGGKRRIIQSLPVRSVKPVSARRVGRIRGGHCVLHGKTRERAAGSTARFGQYGIETVQQVDSSEETIEVSRPAVWN